MSHAEDQRAHARLGEALVRYARASFDAIALIEQDVSLDIKSE